MTRYSTSNVPVRGGHLRVGIWDGDRVPDYVDYDLVGSAPRLRSSCRYDAVSADSAQLLGADSGVLAAWDALGLDVGLLTAPRGLLDEHPGLFPPAELDAWQRRIPRLRGRQVADVNHQTITLTDRGANEVADEVRASAALSIDRRR